MVIGPGQLIDKLDDNHDTLVSIKELEKNFGKLSEKERKELGLLLEQKNCEIQKAFTDPETGKNILVDLSNNLTKEEEELTLDDKKILNLCETIGIIDPSMKAYIKKIQEIMATEHKRADENKDNKGVTWRIRKEDLFPGSVDVETQDLNQLFETLYELPRIFKNNSIFSDEDGHLNMYDNHTGTVWEEQELTNAFFTSFNKKCFYNYNYEIGYKLENILSGLATVLGKLSSVRNNAEVDALVKKLVQYEHRVKEIKETKDHFNEILREEISLDELLSGVGLPQLPGLAKTGIKVTRQDGKKITGLAEDEFDELTYMKWNAEAEENPNKGVYFNYTIKKGNANIFITWYLGEGYKITGYYKDPSGNVPIFGAEVPLAEKMDALYNILGYKKTISQGGIELKSWDQTGLSEEAKKIISSFTEIETLDLTGLSQQDVYTILYILTGKIQVGYVSHPHREYVKSINMSECNLTSLPPEIKEFKYLEKLDISGNKLTALPKEIGNLKNMDTFDAKDNQISTLPPEMGNLKELLNLDISNNQLSSLPPEIGNIENVMNLNLSNNQLSSLPPEIGKLKRLITFNLSKNQLASLPPEIKNLIMLTNLQVSKNQLGALPPELARLELLKILDMSDNKISVLPPELMRLRRLENLNVSNNQLMTLPKMNEMRKIDVTYNFLPPSEQYNITNCFDLKFFPQKGEEDEKSESKEEAMSESELEKLLSESEGGENGGEGDISDIFEKQEGEYLEKINKQHNPASDIIASMPGTQDLSSFESNLGNALPSSKDKSNPKLIESITPALLENYRGGVFDVMYDSKTNTSSQAKIEDKYKKVNVKEMKKENTQVYTMKFGILPPGTHQIILPLGARIVDEGVLPDYPDAELQYDKKSGLYRLVTPHLLGGLDLQFVLKQETNGYKSRDYQLDDYKNILPNIGPEFGVIPTIYKISEIKAWIQSHSYYGYDTELDTQLTPYKNNPVEYCQKLYETGIQKYEGMMMMVCNQSALLATLLLKKNGIPARIAVGVPGNKEVSGPGHARTEYRFDGQRHTLDATPSMTPPEHLAKEMYDRQKSIKEKIKNKKMELQESKIFSEAGKEKKGTRSFAEKLVAEFDLLPETIKNKVNFQNMEELNLENIPLTDQQLKIVLGMLIFNRKTSDVKNIFLGGTGITELPLAITKFTNLEILDISDTNIAASEATKLLGLKSLRVITPPQSRYDDKSILQELKDIFRREIIVKPQ